jgi:hypothetical protein
MSQLVMGFDYAPRQTEAAQATAAIVLVKAASVAEQPRPETVTTRVTAKTKTTDARARASWRGEDAVLYPPPPTSTASHCIVSLQPSWFSWQTLGEQMAMMVLVEGRAQQQLLERQVAETEMVNVVKMLSKGVMVTIEGNRNVAGLSMESSLSCLFSLIHWGEGQAESGVASSLASPPSASYTLLASLCWPDAFLAG